MSGLVYTKNAMNKVYAKYAAYINPLLKFILALLTFFIINVKIGYMDKINNGAIVLLVALFCSFMPLPFMAFMECIFILLHFYALSLEPAIVGAVFLFLMYILFIRFTPKESVLVLLMPIFFVLKIPYLMPLVAGLIGTPVSVITVAFGVGISYLIEWTSANAELFTATGDATLINKLRVVIDGMLGNKSMIFMIVSFAVVVVMVYTIRKLAIKQSWLVAIASGTVMDIILLYVFLIKYNLDYSILGIMFGNLVSAVLAMVVTFFVHNLDYRKTENLQFEDEEYYYYVKAVPKMGATGTKRKAPSVSSAVSRESSSTEHTYRTANGVKRTTR